MGTRLPRFLNLLRSVFDDADLATLVPMNTQSASLLSHHWRHVTIINLLVHGPYWPLPIKRFSQVIHVLEGPGCLRDLVVVVTTINWGRLLVKSLGCIRRLNPCIRREEIFLVVSWLDWARWDKHYRF